jgi:hypothetical protein
MKVQYAKIYGSTKQIIFIKLTTGSEAFDKFWLLKFYKEGASVVTHFYPPNVGDGVYPFLTKCRSLAHGSWMIE